MEAGDITIEKAILLDVCFGIPIGRVAFPTPRKVALTADTVVPDTFLFRGEQLAEMKALRAAGDSDVATAVSDLLALAREAVSRELVSVTDKPQSRLSSDPHDYQSIAKYWWPNPATATRLPYVNRDGEINPECYSDDFDAGRLSSMSDTVVLLALAAYLGDDKACGGRAEQWLKHWFLDPETRQNPNFQFAQIVSGRSEVRWQGTIEARHLIYVTEAVQVLSAAGEVSAETVGGVKAWFSELLDWMLTSEQGQGARDADNNIGFWHDLQCMAYAQFCGRADVARAVATETLLPRISRQIEPNGAMPGELHRAHPHDYVAFTVTALAMLGRMGEREGLDLWDQAHGDGRNFDVAHDWLVRAQWQLFSRIAGTDEGPEADRHNLLLSVGMRLRAADRAAALAAHTSGIGALQQATDHTAKTDQEIVELQQSLRVVNDELRAARTRDTGIAKAEFERVLGQREELVAYAAKLESRLALMRDSTSWRLTKPVRFAARAASQGLSGARTESNPLPKRPKFLGDGDDGRLRDVTPEPGASGVPHREQSRTDGRLVSRLVRVAKRWVRGKPVGTGGFVPSDESLLAIRSHQPANEEALKQDYQASGLDRDPDSFVLYRIVGNDLVPRHKKGQSRENVQFVLENEPVLEGCEKRWILNRIVDDNERAQIVALLEAHGQTYITIPFDAEEYRRIGWDFGALPTPDYLASKAFQKLEPEMQDRARTAVYRLKNNYLMNNNGARNAALRDGQTAAKWVLPWDGNCFVTREAWSEITAAVRARPHVKYFVVPMERITDNDDLLRDDFVPRPVEEPQLLFRCDAREAFNPEFSYGRRPKVELFWRLGIPGPWDRWTDDPWDQMRRAPAAEAGQFAAAGWVARMFSGAKHLEHDTRASFKNRGLARQEAIVAAIDHVDRQLLSARLTCYDEAALDEAKLSLTERPNSQAGRLAANIVADAEQAMREPLVSVVQKTTLPPSGNIHDYWHPAPYWWPDPSKPDGRPYIKKDGQRVPGTVMYEPDSGKYDRTRLRLMFDRTLSLALAWRLTGRSDFAECGAAQLRTWFLDDATRMTPHLRYSQVRTGHNGDEGNGTGIIEFKDFYYFLDAAKLLERAGALTDGDVTAFKTWLGTYLSWLSDSKPGRKEAGADNNHGTYFDLQVAAIHAYLGDLRDLDDVLMRAQKRIDRQFTPDGQQPHEMNRTITQHYCFFNLQGWFNIANLAAASSLPFGDWPRPAQARIGAALTWVLGQDMNHWPFAQIEPFDAERVYPLASSALQVGIRPPSGFAADDIREAKSVFDPHDAVHPYWNLQQLVKAPAK